MWTSGVPDTLVSSALVFRRSSVQVLPPAPALALARYRTTTTAPALQPHLRHLSIIIILIAPYGLSSHLALYHIALHASLLFHHYRPRLRSLSIPSDLTPIIHPPHIIIWATHLTTRTPSYDRAAPPYGPIFSVSLRAVLIHLFTVPVSMGLSSLLSDPSILCSRIYGPDEPRTRSVPVSPSSVWARRTYPFPYLRPPYVPDAPIRSSVLFHGSVCAPGARRPTNLICAYVPSRHARSSSCCCCAWARLLSVPFPSCADALLCPSCSAWLSSCAVFSRPVASD